MSDAEFRILLIEDNPADARLIQLMVTTGSESAYQVHHVNRLAAALDRIAQIGADVVLLDLSLPDSQGLDTFSLLRARAPDLPIVVLSGLDDESVAIEAVRAGAQDYLVKGRVQPDVLLRSVRYAIERNRLERERVQLLLASKEAEARYYSLFDGVTDAILVADAEGRYVDANRSATELFGYPREELLRMRVGDLSIAPREQTRTMFEEFKRTGRHAAAGEVRRKDGAVVPVLGRGARLELESGTVFLGIVQDISEQLALEQLRSQFMAMVTHELRNPLASIKAYAQLMQRQEVYDPRAISMIISQTDHLSRLLGDLLTVVRSESGKLELRKEMIDLRSVLEACVDQVQASTRNHTLRLHLPERPLVGHWDRDRVEEILRNLLMNGIKYSDGGEIVVVAEGAEHEIRISVTDEGKGIPPELQPRLFERFSRGHEANEQAEGLGLGLYITKMLVEAHGGRIWAASRPNRGSTFAFSLPYTCQQSADGQFLA